MGYLCTVIIGTIIIQAEGTDNKFAWSQGQNGLVCHSLAH